MTQDEKYPLALPGNSILAGQYIIENVLGQGGFGITYRAVDHKTGYRVAIKEFFPDTMATRNRTTVTAFAGERGESFEYGKRCFIQEAETLAEFIGNENIVKIRNYFEENGTAYFVMDYVKGKSFDEYIKEKGGRVSLEEAEKILVPVMDALSLVHSRGIIHRDVTPDNIFISEEGVVKLLDFGAARYSLGDKSRSLDVVLKHGFAPKEQYTRHGRQGPYTDIYTLGASFYFAITGRRPPDSIDRIEKDDLVLPSILGVKISPKKEEAILMAMNVQPQDRFQSMNAFKAAILSGAESAGAGNAPLADAGSAYNMRAFTAPQQPVNGQAQPQNAQPQQSPLQYEQPQGAYAQNPAPKAGRKKWILPAGIGAGVLVLVIIIAVAVSGGNKKDNKPASYVSDNTGHGTVVSEEPGSDKDSDTGSDKGSDVNSGNTETGTNFAVYNNNTACFSLDYPEGYSYTEPAETNVLFTDGSSADFQLHAEYNFYTPVTSSIIYSAEDFCAQVEGSGGQLLRDWIGVDYTLISSEELHNDMGGAHCYCYSFEYNYNGSKYTGKLYIRDGSGEIGCYTLMWSVNESSPKAGTYKEQAIAMTDSFKVTGKYQPDNLSVVREINVDGADISFITARDGFGKISPYGDHIIIYPVEGVFTESNICVRKTAWGTDDSLDRVMSSQCGYYLEYKDNTEITSNPEPYKYGRYTYTMESLTYEDSGNSFQYCCFVFPYNGDYWKVEAETTGQHYDKTMEALGSVLLSLKMDDGESYNENAY